jgi:[ribosomal protein S18]-alanine N-acetyltransferase
MMQFLASLLARGEPRISEATARDAADMAALHAACFNRGWSEHEFERLLADRGVVAHRVMIGPRLVGFVISRIISGEAEVLSVAIAAARRGRGLARRMLSQHLRRLHMLGTRIVFLEVNESNIAATRLYQRAGFETVGRREGYYPERNDRDGDFPGQVNRSATALVLRCEFP